MKVTLISVLTLSFILALSKAAIPPEYNHEKLGSNGHNPHLISTHQVITNGHGHDHDHDFFNDHGVDHHWHEVEHKWEHESPGSNHGHARVYRVKSKNFEHNGAHQNKHSKVT